jgi:hypothetical protein
MIANTVSYQLTKGEWTLAALIWLRRKPVRLFSLGFFALVTILFLAFDIVFLTESLRSRTVPASTIGSFILILVFPLAVAGLRLRGVRQEIRSLMQPDWDAEITLKFETSALSVSNPGVSENRYFWSSIRSVVETKRFGLIYLAKRDCIAFPKRALPEGALASLHAYARQGTEATKP